MNKADKVYLITKADDIGSNHSANRAFYDGYKQGILRNGVIMMTCSSAKEAADMFKNEKGFCMGLHLTLNAEWDSVKWGPVLPAGKVQSLIDKDGYLFQTTQKLHENNPRLDEIMAELQAQLDLAREYGLNIRFADCHMGFNWVHKELEGELEKWIERNGLINFRGAFKQLPKGEAGADRVESFLSRLKGAEPGIYFIHMGHPAYDTSEMRALGHTGYPGDKIADERDGDRLTLMDPRVVEFFKANDIIPVTLDEGIKMVR